MSRALLSLEADPAQFRQVMAGMRQESRTTAQAIAGDFKKMGADGSKSYRQLAAAAAAAQAKVVEAEQKMTEAATQSAERRKAVVDQEAGYRTNALKAVASNAKRTEEDVSSSTARESRRRISTLEREVQQRRRLMREAGAHQGEAFAGRAMGVGREIYGAVTGERPRAASIERNVGNAIYQAGGDLSAVRSTTGALQRFARDRGLDATELASALAGAQTEFSVLGNARTSTADRNRNFEQFLSAAALGQATGNNVGEFTRLAGLFSDSGITGDQQRQMLLFAAGAAQRGAVEVGGVTRESMSAIRSRMAGAAASARRDGRDPVAAMQTEFRQAFSEIEVARSSGESARAGGNAMASLSRALTSTAVQDKLRNNIANAQSLTADQRRQLTSTLFEADPTRHGQQRLRGQYTNALDFIGVFGSAGLDQNAFMNITRGGGQGNPLSLLENQRRVLGSLLNTDAEGRSGLTRVRDIMGSGALSEADVTRGEGIFTQDRQAQLNKETETRSMELTDNTSAIVRLTEEINRSAAEHPFLAPVGEALTDFAGSRTGRFLGGLAGGAGGVGAGVARVSGRLAGAAAFLMPSNAGEASVSERELIRRWEAAGGGRVGVEAARVAMGTGQADLVGGRVVRLDPSSSQAIGQHTAQALRSAGGIPVQMPANDESHARARGASGSPPPAP